MAGYKHDDPRFSDCERGNASSHLRAALLGRSVAVGISGGELSLGRFQSILFAELDGPAVAEHRHPDHGGLAQSGTRDPSPAHDPSASPSARAISVPPLDRLDAASSRASSTGASGPPRPPW